MSGTPQLRGQAWQTAPRGERARGDSVMISPVTPNQPGPDGASVGFAERLPEVIDFGRRTATYKLAVLIALLDLCARHSDASGRAPPLLYTRDIAEQVAVLYWPQVIPYLVPGAGAAVAAANHAAQGGHPHGGQRVPPRGRRRRDPVMASGPPAAARCLPDDAGSGRGYRRRAAPALAAGSRVQRHRLPVPLRTQLGTAGVLLGGAAAPPRPPRPRHPAAARRRR